MEVTTKRTFSRTQKIRISTNQKLRIGVLSLFLVLYPFLFIFGKAGVRNPGDNALLSFYNYAALALSFILLLLFHRPFPKCVLKIAAVLIGMLLFNYAVTEYASLKWLLNWLGFIFISVVIVNSIASLGEMERVLLQRHCSTLIRFILIVISLIMITTWYSDTDALLGNIFVKPQNVILLLTLHAGIDKQSMGIFFGMIFTFGFCFWRTWSFATKLLLLATLILSIPALLGIRTLYLGMTLVGAWYYLTKRSSNKDVLLVASLSSIAIACLYPSELADYAANSYDRINSLKLSLATLFSTPFGVGNGGYTQFVIDNEASILTQFGSELMIARDAFWTAPESDLVYFFASWGVLSAFFFGFYAHMLSAGRKLLRIRSLQPIEKTLILMSWLMIFMGISQDNAGHTLWWIYMAAGYGVILRHRYLRPRHLRHRKVISSYPV